MGTYYIINDDGALLGHTSQQPKELDFTEVDPKGIKIPTWDGKGWVEGKKPVPYADFADYGYKSAVEFATAEAGEAISGGRTVLTGGVDTTQLVAAVDQLIVFAKGGTADVKALDAFVAANADRTAGLNTLASLQTTLDTKPKLAGVVAIINAVRDLPALNS